MSNNSSNTSPAQRPSSFNAVSRPLAANTRTTRFPLVGNRRTTMRPLPEDYSDVPVLEDENLPGAEVPLGNFRRSKSTTFVRSNGHSYLANGCYGDAAGDEDEADLRGSMRAASRKYQETVARLRSSQREENRNHSPATNGNRCSYLRQNSSPAAASPGNNQWETSSVVSSQSYSSRISQDDNRQSNFPGNGFVAMENGHFQDRLKPFQSNTGTTSSLQRNPLATHRIQNGGLSNNSNNDPPRVSISRNSGQYADVTEKPHVTGNNVISGNGQNSSSGSGFRQQNDDVTTGSGDEEQDLMTSMHPLTRGSVFRRSAPRRHSYHNLKNAYQSQAAFRRCRQIGATEANNADAITSAAQIQHGLQVSRRYTESCGHASVALSRCVNLVLAKKGFSVHVPVWWVLVLVLHAFWNKSQEFVTMVNDHDGCRGPKTSYHGRRKEGFTFCPRTGLDFGPSWIYAWAPFWDFGWQLGTTLIGSKWILTKYLPGW